MKKPEPLKVGSFTLDRQGDHVVAVLYQDSPDRSAHMIQDLQWTDIEHIWATLGEWLQWHKREGGSN